MHQIKLHTFNSVLLISKIPRIHQKGSNQIEQNYNFDQFPEVFPDSTSVIPVGIFNIEKQGLSLRILK